MNGRNLLVLWVGERSGNFVFGWWKMKRKLNFIGENLRMYSKVPKVLQQNWRAFQLKFNWQICLVFLIYQSNVITEISRAHIFPKLVNFRAQSKKSQHRKKINYYDSLLIFFQQGLRPDIDYNTWCAIESCFMQLN